ncbi:MAG TPA: prolyl oligopeptidase family serine peptidase, partial [Actinoplanes sp.]|nr:prolyl oligopeptidase family serine peptidase [Actinoplanes sp.]
AAASPQRAARTAVPALAPMTFRDFLGPPPATAGLDVETVERIGFSGHSYGGRMALWAPAYDQRFAASVSHCGCIPYRHSYSPDTGVQAEFVLPGFAAAHDLEDVIAEFGRTALLISGGRADKWSRGAEELAAALGDRVELALYDAGHVFTAPMRERAYRFLTQHC